MNQRPDKQGIKARKIDINIKLKPEWALVSTTVFPIFLLLFPFVVANESWGETLYPTVNGIRDYDSPSVTVTEHGEVYLNVPGTNIRNYDAPAYQIDDDGSLYQTEYGLRTFDAAYDTGD